MTEKRTESGIELPEVEMSNGTGRVSEKPKVPDVERSLDCDHFVQQGLAILKDAGLDTSGYRKARTEALRLGVNVDAIDKIQKELLAKLKPARLQLEQLKGRLLPYQTARLPAPEKWERELYDEERRVSDTQMAFDNGGDNLREAGALLQEARTSARCALAGALTTYSKGLGVKVKDLVEPDAGFLLAHSHRVPREVMNLQREAVKVNEIIPRLTGQPGRAYKVFEEGCGEIGIAVLLGVMGSPVREIRKARRDPSELLDKELGGVL